jgi:hypothetical protein
VLFSHRSCRLSSLSEAGIWQYEVWRVEKVKEFGFYELSCSVSRICLAAVIPPCGIFLLFRTFGIYYIIMATSMNDKNKETNGFLTGGKTHLELVHTN